MIKLLLETWREYCVDEIIQHPPRDIRAMLKIIKSNVVKTTTLFDEITQIITQISDGDMLQDLEASLRPINFSDIERMRDTVQEISTMLLEKIGWYYQFVNDPQYRMKTLKYLSDSFEYAEKRRNNVAWYVQEMNNNFDEIAEKLQDHYEYYQDQFSLKLLEKLRELPNVFAKFVGVWRYKDSLLELARINSVASYTSHASDVRPPSEAVEILYHASVNARKIYENGFNKEIPDIGGLGGSQMDQQRNKAISFTSDLYVAKEIARSLKESIMIAQGKYKLPSLLNAIKHDSENENILNYFKSAQGYDMPKDVYDIFELYRTYLSLSSQRYNPMYFGDVNGMVDYFAAQSYKNVGVLKCKVDMTDPDILYLYSMHEYRVKPDSVISIEGMIQ